MKRYFAVMLLLTLILSSCGKEKELSAGKEESVSESELSETEETVLYGETSADAEPKILYSSDDTVVYVEQALFGYPKTKATDADLRRIVVEYVLDMASVEWKPESRIDLTDIDPGLVYKENETYFGMSYNWNNVSDFETFSDCVSDGIFNYDDGVLPGCTSSNAILKAWRLVAPGCNFSYTKDMMPVVFDNGVVPVGNVPWEKYDGTRSKNGNTVESVLNAVPKEQIYDAYSKTAPGDAFLIQTEGSGMAYMVTSETSVVRNDAGEIDPVSSKVYLTTQSRLFNDERSHPSNWSVNREYTFEEIYSLGLLPIKVPELDGGIAPEPYFTYIPQRDVSCVITSPIPGRIESNYEIKTFTVTLTRDEDGEVVKSFTLHPNEMSVDLEKATIEFGLFVLPSGEYTVEAECSNVLLTQTVLRAKIETHKEPADSTD